MTFHSVHFLLFTAMCVALSIYGCDSTPKKYIDIKSRAFELCAEGIENPREISKISVEIEELNIDILNALKSENREEQQLALSISNSELEAVLKNLDIAETNGETLAASICKSSDLLQIL